MISTKGGKVVLGLGAVIASIVVFNIDATLGLIALLLVTVVLLSDGLFWLGYNGHRWLWRAASGWKLLGVSIVGALLILLAVLSRGFLLATVFGGMLIPISTMDRAVAISSILIVVLAGYGYCAGDYDYRNGIRS